MFRFALVLCLISSPALAGLEVRFLEGAPKDRIVVANVGSCAVENASLEIDFSKSEGRLIFDTTSEGAGVEVFQPVEVVHGAEALSETPAVEDGETTLTLAISSLAPEARIILTMDIDDTIGEREITVTEGEFAGTHLVYYSAHGKSWMYVLNAENSGVVGAADCATS
ncbi:MAG: aggregation factor core [Pseudomonadota bacterium]